MKVYHDRWGCNIVEQPAVFMENGGYTATITMKPRNWWTKLLFKLRLSMPSLIMVEICEDFRETINVNLKAQKQNPGKYSGIFLTTKGTKILRISMDPDALENWDMNVRVDRIFS